MSGFIATVIFVFQIALIVRVVLSWFPGGGPRPVNEIVHRVTEPVLGPIRRALPSFGGLDLSPLVVILVLNVILQVL